MLALPGDLLFTRYNGNLRFVGACAEVPADAPRLTYPDKLIRVRMVADASPSFIALACSVGESRQQIQASVRTTAGQAGISGHDLKNVIVRIPSKAGQANAVAEYMHVAQAVDSLAQAAIRAQDRSATLRRSLLAAAFRGDLTADFRARGGGVA
jgi:type I restriction enzyme S subunit